MYGCSKDCIPFRLPQISCFTLSLECFSSDSVAPMWGSGPCFSFPKGQFHQVPPRVGPVLLTLPFFSLVPSFYRVLCGSIYLFSLVRYSCPLSADVLAALPCLKVCSWCVCGERCTPCLPPLLSHPPGFYLLIDYQPLTFERLHVAIQVSVVSRKFGIALLTSLPTWQHLVVFRQILCSQFSTASPSKPPQVHHMLALWVLSFFSLFTMQNIAVELRCYISLLIPFFLRKTANFCKY